jgi:hypothetical protein
VRVGRRAVLAGADDHTAEAVSHSIGGNRLIALVTVLATARALFLDVVDLTIRRQFVIPAGYTAAREGRKTEKANKAHGRLLPTCIASAVPDF